MQKQKNIKYLTLLLLIVLMSLLIVACGKKGDDNNDKKDNYKSPDLSKYENPFEVVYTVNIKNSVGSDLLFCDVILENSFTKNNVKVIEPLVKNSITAYASKIEKGDVGSSLTDGDTIDVTIDCYNGKGSATGIRYKKGESVTVDVQSITQPKTCSGFKLSNGQCVTTQAPSDVTGLAIINNYGSMIVCDSIRYSIDKTHFYTATYSNTHYIQNGVAQIYSLDFKTVIQHISTFNDGNTLYIQPVCEDSNGGKVNSNVVHTITYKLGGTEEVQITK